MRYVLSIGSNMGDRRDAIERAIRAVLLIPRTCLVARSSLYETAPWGKLDQEPFYNMALIVESEYTPREVLHAIQSIENLMGRVRDERWGPRIVDIDMIAAEKTLSHTSELILPHPRAAERAFVLVPWLEIDPEAEIAKVGRVADLVAQLDTSTVVRLDG